MKIALILLAFLACMNLALANYPDPVGYTRSLDKSRKPPQAGPYYPALHTVVQGEEDSDSDSSSSEEVTPRTRTRLSYRRDSTYRKKSPRPETRSLDTREPVVDEDEQVPRRVYDYGMYDRSGRVTTEAPETTTRYQWQWRPCYSEQECYRQYVNEYYRYYSQNQGGSSSSSSSSSTGSMPSSSSTTSARRTSTSDSSSSDSGAVPTKLPPRLLLKSGDNVHFGEGINWSIYKTDSGLTRVGTRDGEVVVRVVRPNYEDYEQRRRMPQQPTTTQPPPPAVTPYQWQWQPCHTEQECYRQYVNEYYRYYAHNQ